MKFVKLLSFLVLVMLLSVSDITAQITTDTLGTGTSSSATRGPFQRSDTASSSVYSRAQLMYSQAELATTLGIPSGANITQINWDLGSTNVITATGTATLNIYMKNSMVTDAILDDTWSNITTGATLVGTYTFDATTNNFPGVKGLMNFVLATPFTYTGNTIEVAVEWDCSGLTTTSTNPVNANKLFSGNGSLNWRWDNTAHVSTLYRAGSSSAPTVLNKIKSERVNTQFVYTTGGSMADSVDITMEINTANIVANGGTVSADGIYLAGGLGFGIPGDNPATDLGNGIWSITVKRAKGFSSHYTFLNGNCPGWGCKENISGLPCADPNNFDDRFLPGVYSDTTILACFGSCESDGTCTAPTKVKPDLPITFEDTANINYALVDFGGDSSVITVDPTDPNNTVVESTKKAGSEVWAGTVVADAGLLNPIPFAATGTKMVVRVWSPDANTPVLLKVEDANDSNIASEVQATTTVAGAWEDLVFDFANGTPALDFANTYNKVVIFFDFGTVGTGKTYYWDNVDFGGHVSTNQLLVDNDLFSLRPNVTTDYTNIVFADNAVMEQKTIEVFNSLGELVMTEIVENTNVYRMNVNRFPAGMYFVNVQSDNKMATKRLVIQK